MKYFIITGETSGDLHAANLMRAIQQKDKQAQFEYYGGDQMQKVAQLGLKKHISELSFMGFVEVVKNLKTIFRNLAHCQKCIDAFLPDVVILVDFPGFNLRMAKFCFQRQIQTFYYISPQLWAWKESRVKKIRKYVNQLYVILPFEQDFYQKHEIQAHYFGNPIIEEIQPKNTSVDQDLIALLPGSRTQEIKRMLPIMSSFAKHHPNKKFILLAVNHIDQSLYQHFTASIKNIQIKYNALEETLSKASFAMVTSGTATLQTALYKVPQIVCYKANKLSYLIAKVLIKVKYISLVNLILDKPCVPELIQDELNLKNLKATYQKCTQADVLSQTQLMYNQLRAILGTSNVSERVADHMIQHINKR